PGATRACNGYYAASLERLFLCTDLDAVTVMRMPEDVDNPRKDPGARFASSGMIDLGYFYGGLRMVDKDFHDVIIDGDCITLDTPVRVYWSDVLPDDCSVCEGAFTAPMKLLRELTTSEGRLAWPCEAEGRPGGKVIRLWVELATNDPAKTPVVRAISLRFLPQV